MEQKSKYAVLIYPDFSLQEITCLTSALTVWFGESIDILASERKPCFSEEGFQITPAKTVDEANPADYACIILPGTINPLHQIPRAEVAAMAVNYQPERPDTIL